MSCTQVINVKLTLKIVHEAFTVHCFWQCMYSVLTKLFVWIYIVLLVSFIEFIRACILHVFMHKLLNCCSSHPTCRMSLQRKACCRGWTPTSNIKTGVSSRSKTQNGRHIQPFLLSWELMANPVKMLAGSKVNLDC